MQIKRHDWPRALATQSTKQLTAVLNEMTTRWTITPVQLPQTGLGMLQLRDSAFNDPYFLGEIPLASAWVSIRTEDQQEYQGAAQLMDDDQDKIEALAVCDAILAYQLPGWQALYQLVEIGMAALTQEQQLRKAMLAKTRVDFALLNATEQDDD
ncbi:MAG: phosphonate C-P lyase system protein PhnG [Methylococcaceae bacterium]|nr:phosphonate C-P lyase system protein PhnG [Methylococcaceae bacterium]MDZ4097315.1 phosphonate C-P lyase system protein PhnG [Methylophilaceae bacterium]MDZ4218575.1 phosphonate C-P lyase system protein PhnG [Methylobacter sp.]MDP2391952.1 phosphonate C-P lyase system protein PhnG [Methylococcaceae bacterium]MDP3018808.1 phosphonate C-P lyase system protein PhnG [Methylococcaceae bacterium]